jgi:hypothetical protein
MPDQPSDTRKTAIKIALGAALGGALGITAALRDKRAVGSGQWAGDGEQRAAGGGQSVLDRAQREADRVGVARAPSGQDEPPSYPQHSALSTQHSPAHPDWEPLPAAHLPRPTYWPVVLAVGVVFLAWGVVTTIAITVIGLVLLALGLGGWIGELRHGH